MFLPSFAHCIEQLPQDTQLEMFWAITNYGLYGTKPKKGSVVAATLELITPIIDASQNRYRSAVENGKKGGRPKKASDENQSETRRKPEGNQRVNQDIDIDSEIENKNGKEKESLRGKEKENQNFSGDADASGCSATPGPPLYYPLDEKLNQALVDFVEYRKSVKAPMNDKAVELLMQKLDTLAKDNNEKISILEQSIVNGWKGVFPLKQEEPQKHEDEGGFWAITKKLAQEEGVDIF